MLSDVIQYLQAAVSPAIIISGVSLFLLVLTNRLGRVLDRGRALKKELDTLTREHAEPAEILDVEAEIALLARRSHLIKYSIIFSTCCTLFASLLILFIFFLHLIGASSTEFPVSIAFFLSLSSLVVGKVIFIIDTIQSLDAFQIELKRHT